MSVKDRATYPFLALGKSTRIATSATTANGALNVPPAGTMASQAVYQAQIYNNSTAVAYVNFGTSNAVTASVGTDGAATADFPVAPGATIVVTMPFGATYVAAILGSATTGDLAVTCGVGV